MAARHPVAEYLLMSMRLAVYGFDPDDVRLLMRTGYTDLADDECDRLLQYAAENGLRGGRLGRARLARGGGQAVAAAEPLRLRLVEPVLALRDGLRAARDAEGQLRAIWRLMESTRAFEKLTTERERLVEMGLPLRANESAQVWNRVVGSLDQMHELLGDARVPSRDLYELLRQSLTAGEIKAPAPVSRRRRGWPAEPPARPPGQGADPHRRERGVGRRHRRRADARGACRAGRARQNVAAPGSLCPRAIVDARPEGGALAGRPLSDRHAPLKRPFGRASRARQADSLAPAAVSAPRGTRRRAGRGLRSRSMLPDPRPAAALQLALPALRASERARPGGAAAAYRGACWPTPNTANARSARGRGA